MHWLRRITGALFLVGAALLVLHVAGRFVPLRPSAIYAEPTGFDDDITLTYAEARAQLVRRPGENPLDFAERATHVVSHAMAHYWKAEGAARFHLRVPPWENYVMWLAGVLRPRRFGQWEYADPDKALERGVGLCSQQTIVLVRALRRQGVVAVLVSLQGHVVGMAGSGTRVVLLDPDYDVVVPHGLREVEKDPEIVRPYYAAKYPPEVVDRLVGIYGSGGYQVDATGVANYTQSHRAWEFVFYSAAWAIPLALMAPHGLVIGASALRRRLKRDRRP